MPDQNSPQQQVRDEIDRLLVQYYQAQGWAVPNTRLINDSTKKQVLVRAMAAGDLDPETVSSTAPNAYPILNSEAAKVSGSRVAPTTTPTGANPVAAQMTLPQISATPSPMTQAMTPVPPAPVANPISSYAQSPAAAYVTNPNVTNPIDTIGQWAQNFGNAQANYSPTQNAPMAVEGPAPVTYTNLGTTPVADTVSLPPTSSLPSALTSDVSSSSAVAPAQLTANDRAAAIMSGNASASEKYAALANLLATASGVTPVGDNGLPSGDMSEADRIKTLMGVLSGDVSASRAEAANAANNAAAMARTQVGEAGATARANIAAGASMANAAAAEAGAMERLRLDLQQKSEQFEKTFGLSLQQFEEIKLQNDWQRKFSETQERNRIVAQLADMRMSGAATMANTISTAQGQSLQAMKSAWPTDQPYVPGMEPNGAWAGVNQSLGLPFNAPKVPQSTFNPNIAPGVAGDLVNKAISDYEQQMKGNLG